MIERRTFLTGATVAAAGGSGVASAIPGGHTPAAPLSSGDESAELRQIRDELQRLRESSQSLLHDAIEAVREQQRIFLKSALKYPDFIEVGLTVWEGVYDWHVRWQQPISISRMPDGQYGMAFTLTTLVLRPNMQPNYVGPGYDSK